MDEAVSNAATAFFKVMGWQLSPEDLKHLQDDINLSTSGREAAERMVNTGTITRQRRPPPKAN